MRAALRAVAWAALLSVAADAAPPFAAAGPPAFPLSPPLTPSQLQNATLAVVAAAFPSNGSAVTPIRCASARVAAFARAAGGGPLGDAFLRLRPTASDAVAAVAALGEGGVYSVDAGSAPQVLAGSNAWLLQYINASLPASVPLLYDLVRVPDAVWAGGAATQTALESYLLDTLGYDCSLDASVETAEAWLYHGYLRSHQSFGFTVVTAAPVITPQSSLSALFTWIKPFSPGVWGLIVVSFVISSLLMTVFELDHSLADWDIADFGPRDGSQPRRGNYVVHGTYIAIASFTSQNCEMFVASSVSGRVFRIIYSFFIMLSCSCYVANLATVLSQPPQATAVITSIDSFARHNVKACVLNLPEHLAFMAANYPQVTLHVVDSTYEGDLLAQLVADAPPCGGAVAPQAPLNFLMGPAGDPNGAFCSLTLVGGPLSDGSYAVAFNRRFPATQLGALAGLVAAAVSDGTYGAAMAAEGSFPTQRSNCATTASIVYSNQGSLELSILEFSGVFVILALGGVLCLLMHNAQKFLRRRRVRGESLSQHGRDAQQPVGSGLMSRMSSGRLGKSSSRSPPAQRLGEANGDAEGGKPRRRGGGSSVLEAHAAAVRSARAEHARLNADLQAASGRLEARLRAAVLDLQDLTGDASVLEPAALAAFEPDTAYANGNHDAALAAWPVSTARQAPDTQRTPQSPRIPQWQMRL